MIIQNSLIICYKEPTKDLILNIMEENSLFERDKLLKNIEKVIPISKILRSKKNKSIKNVIFDNKNDRILFYLYF